jgi:hypothetical protein
MLPIKAKGTLDNRLDQRLLGLEVINDAGLADTGLGGHGIERQAGCAQPGNDGLSGIQNGLLIYDALSSHDPYSFISDQMVIKRDGWIVKTKSRFDAERQLWRCSEPMMKAAMWSRPDP